MSVVTQKVEIQDSFEIDACRKYDMISEKAITLLKNTPNSVQYAEINHATNLGQSFTFQTTLNPFTFIDRGVILQMDIPITLTAKTNFKLEGVDTIPDATNYAQLCDGFNSIAWRRFGALSGIQNMEVLFNDATVSNITDLYKALETVSEYYNSDAINKNMSQSQPDRFTNYALYDAKSAIKFINTFDENGNPIQMQIPAVANENVFTGGYSNEYNSRKTAFKYVGATLNTIRLSISGSVYLPFSVFGLSDSDYSLYGIQNFTLNGNLKANFVKEMFVMSNDFFTTLDADYTDTTAHKCRLLLKYYSPPQYIMDAMRDPMTGHVKPYRINYNTIQIAPVVLQTVTANVKRTGLTIVTPQISMGVIPASVYLSVHNVRNKTTPWTDACFKGRIKSVIAKIGSHETTIGQNVLRIYNIARSNGLNADYESAIFTSGSVLKLDFQKDLSMGGGALLGANIPTTLQFDVIFDSLSEQASVDYELRCVIVIASQIRFYEQAFTTVRSLVLSTTQFDISNHAASLYSVHTPNMITIGGGFFSDLWSGIKNGVSKGWNYVKENPDEVFKFGKKLLTGTGMPSSSNVIGGSQTMILGAGNISPISTTYVGAGKGSTKSPFKK